MSLPQDMIYETLLRLPVSSLLRFKSVCKSWCDTIDSSYFIKQHVHRHHHYDHQTSVQDRKLIFPLPSVDEPQPRIFLLTSIQDFDVPPVKLQLKTPTLGYADYAGHVVSMATFDGIICMNQREVNNYDRDCTPTKYVVSLLNPATKQVRVLPKSRVSPIALPNSDTFTLGVDMSVSVGFGFDIKSNDYKVVRLFSAGVKGHCEKRVEVYTLRIDSWRSIDAVVPVDIVNCSYSTLRPFQNGTCYCWWGADFISQKGGGSELPNDSILCFDFSSEVFRRVNIPDAINASEVNDMEQLAIIDDKIACISCYDSSHLEIWVLNGYGSGVNESWDIHMKIANFCQTKILWFTPSLFLFSIYGKYVFFESSDGLTGFDYVCRYDLVTKAITRQRVQQFFETIKDHPSLYYILERHGLCLAAEFKESLVPVRRGN